MSLSPFESSVVVAGNWNRAILTPAGIQQRVFNVELGTPIEVMVPIDVLAPFQVIHDGFTVTVHNSRLVVALQEFTYAKLFGAQLLAINALNSLPETPYFAAGINLAFASADSVPEVDDLLTENGIDGRLADQKLTISGRRFGRQLDWNGGQVNLSIDRDEANNRKLSLNIQRTSTNRDELINWLERPQQEVEQLVNTIISKILDLDLPQNA